MSEEEIRRLLQEYPELAERTAAFLAGEPTPQAMEALMASNMERTIQLRLPQYLLDEADALMPRLSSDRELRLLGPIHRSTVLRLALQKGLERLAQDYPPGEQP